MTDPDFQQLKRFAEGMRSFGRVGVFSPLREGERRLFPKAVKLPRRRWDLDHPGKRRFDLLVAANVFMYASDPDRWFRHVLSQCRYFLLLDLVRRRRSEGREFGPDGDCMRYAACGERPRTEAAFELDALGDRVLAARTFDGGANEYDDAPVHVIALIRGDLADPVLRIDDYPTGIRPILPDLSPLHAILSEVERHDLAYHLGIVPALLTDEMRAFLRTLPGMIPVAHGYDHAYPRYAPILETRGDPFNQHTVGVFNEFQGQYEDVILDKLTTARRLLEDGLERPVDAYIPPCNIGDRKTGRALVQAGYRRYLSEKRIPGCALPWWKSEFYGRSPQYPAEKAPGISTLHLTWEADLVREGKGGHLGPMLEDLARRTAEARALEARLAPLVTRF